MEIKAKKTVSITKQMSNDEETGREFTITGDVTADNGTFNRIASGTVKSADGERFIADFGINNGYPLNISYAASTTAQEQVAALEAVHEFSEAAKTLIETV